MTLHGPFLNGVGEHPHPLIVICSYLEFIGLKDDEVGQFIGGDQRVNGVDTLVGAVGVVGQLVADPVAPQVSIPGVLRGGLPQ